MDAMAVRVTHLTFHVPKDAFYNEEKTPVISFEDL
jgi:hypothetical protein